MHWRRVWGLIIRVALACWLLGVLSFVVLPLLIVGYCGRPPIVTGG